MRTIITTTTINRVVADNVGCVVVVTRGDKRAHFSAAPRSSHVPASHASYRASLTLGCEHLLRAVGTLASTTLGLAQLALGWFQEPTKRPMPAMANLASANMALCAARRPATGLHRLRG